MDTKRYARFNQPGHAVTADRTRNSRGVGYSYAHAIIDDHSRLAYSSSTTTNGLRRSPRSRSGPWCGSPNRA